MNHFAIFRKVAAYVLHALELMRGDTPFKVLRGNLLNNVTSVNISIAS